MRIFLIAFVLLVGSCLFALNYSDAWSSFVEIRSYQDGEKLTDLIDLLETDNVTFNDAKLLTLLADCYREKANWMTGKDKVKLYEQARKYAEQSIKMDSNYGYSYYVNGATIGQLATYSGIVKSIFMLGDFDDNIEKAMKLMPEDNYSRIAMGMRYRDTPWPYKNFKKSEKLLLESIELNPGYINGYYELAVLYAKDKKKDKAAELYQKIIEMELQSEYIAQGNESKKDAEKWLNENNY